jgi:hypothetical protein
VPTNACQSPCNILRASADGGASWATIPDNGKVLLEYVQGNMWYGAVMDGQPTLTTVMRSANGGASWETLTLPPLPDGQEMNSYLVAPDQTLFVSSRSDIAALRQGQWTVYPFSLSETDTVADSLELTAISLDQDGRPLKLWGHDEGAHPGTYWHSV